MPAAKARLRNAVKIGADPASASLTILFAQGCLNQCSARQAPVALGKICKAYFLPYRFPGEPRTEDCYLLAGKIIIRGESLVASQLKSALARREFEIRGVRPTQCSAAAAGALIKKTVFLIDFLPPGHYIGLLSEAEPVSPSPPTFANSKRFGLYSED